MTDRWDPGREAFDQYDYVAFVDSEEDRNGHFRHCEGAGMPTMWFREKRKYGYGEVDFVAAGSYQLDDDAADEIERLGHEYYGRAHRMAKSGQKSDVSIGGWRGVISLGGARIDILREWGLQVAPIVFDRDNWERIGPSRNSAE